MIELIYDKLIQEGDYKLVYLGIIYVVLVKDYILMQLVIVRLKGNIVQFIV